MLIKFYFAIKFTRKVKIILLIISILVSTMVITFSCKKEYQDGSTTILSDNPYSHIIYPPNITPPVIDSNSFVGIHKYIFQARCAMPGCHDGTFEPDFRTVQSAYSTLILQPVVKNNTAHSFVYRVKPYDAAMSWLHERIITNDKVLGRMPIYDSMLPPHQITQISNWINSGAPDMFGNLANQPNANPQTFGFVATIPVGGNPYRIDSIRKGNPFMPFLVPNNTQLTIWFGVYDDIQTPLQLTYNKVKFSANALGFNSASSYNLNSVTTPVWMDNLFSMHMPYYYYYTINTASLPNGQPIYFRFYTQDNQHTQPVELPADGWDFYQQSYFSLIVAP